MYPTIGDNDISTTRILKVIIFMLKYSHFIKKKKKNVFFGENLFENRNEAPPFHFTF